MKNYGPGCVSPTTEPFQEMLAHLKTHQCENSDKEDSRFELTAAEEPVNGWQLKSHPLSLKKMCHGTPLKVEIYRSTVSTDGFHTNSIIEQQS